MGCDATNQTAIDKIYAIKKRKRTPLICLLSDFKMAENIYQSHLRSNPFKFSKRPTTVVFDKVKSQT